MQLRELVSSDRYRILIDSYPIPFSFFANTLFKNGYIPIHKDTFKLLSNEIVKDNTYFLKLAIFNCGFSVKNNDLRFYAAETLEDILRFKQFSS